MPDQPSSTHDALGCRTSQASRIKSDVIENCTPFLQEASDPVPGASDPAPASAWLSEEGVGTLALGHVAMLAARRDPAAPLAHSAALKKRFKTVRSRPAAVQARCGDVGLRISVNGWA